MRNPLQWYIDRKIRKAFEEKERAERERIERERIKKKKEAIEKERKELINECVKHLILTGTCHISTSSERMLEGQFIPYEQRASTIIREGIRQEIMRLIFSRAFSEESDMYGHINFRLSDGLKKDIQ